MEAVEAPALVAGHADEELLLRNEYLAAENEILRSKLNGRPRLTHSERIRLARLGKRLGLKALADVAAIVKPETILSWYRKLVAKNFDGSAKRKKRGRPRVNEDIEKLVLPHPRGEFVVGLRSRCGGLVEPRPRHQRRDGWQCLEAPWRAAGPTEKAGDPLAGFIETHQGVIAACDSPDRAKRSSI